MLDEPFLSFLNCYTYLSDLKIGTSAELKSLAAFCLQCFLKVVGSDSLCFASVICWNQIAGINSEGLRFVS